MFPKNPRLEAYGIVFDHRGPADLFDIRERHSFEPDCLPDTGCSRIPDGVGFELPILLATRLRQLMRIVLHLHRYSLLAGGLEHVGNIGPEWRVAPLVGDCKTTIYPYSGYIVHCAKAQDHPVEAGLAIEVALVPA